MAQELLRHRRIPCCDCARSECGDSLLFRWEFFIFSKNFSQTFGAEAKPAVADKECGQLDAAGGANRRPAGDNYISSHRARWTSDAQHPL
jgi:hypothetical protein